MAHIATGLVAVPITFAEAKAFVSQHHRHNDPPLSHKISIGVSLDDKIVGVAIAGRPVSRHFDDGWTLEVSRVATDGTRNACSFLYGAIKRCGRAMGYTRFVTYTLPQESGSSLKASGWILVNTKAGGTEAMWNSRPRLNRPRVDTTPFQMKFQWESK